MANREKLAAYGAWAAVCFFWGTTYLAIRVGLETFHADALRGAAFSDRGRRALLRDEPAEERASARGAGVVRSGRRRADAARRRATARSCGPSSGCRAGWRRCWWRRRLSGWRGSRGFRKDGERVGAAWRASGCSSGFAGLATAGRAEALRRVVGRQVSAGRRRRYRSAASPGRRVRSTRSSRPAGVAPLMGAAVQMLVAGAALTLVGTRGGRVGRGCVLARGAWAALAYLVVFGSIVAYGAYTYAMQKLPLSHRLDLLVHQPRDRGAARLARAWREPLGWRVGGGHRSSSAAWRW